MTKRTGLIVFTCAMLLIAVAYASAFLPGGAPVWGAWLLAAGTCLALVSMMVIGASREGRIGRRLATAFGVVLLIIGGGFAVLLALPSADPADPTLFLGLPVRAAVLLYGIGLLPFFIVPLAYAWTFDEMTLSDADVARVRAAAAAAGTLARPMGGVADPEAEPEPGATSIAPASGPAGQAPGAEPVAEGRSW
jgi:MFS family permease